MNPQNKAPQETAVKEVYAGAVEVARIEVVSNARQYFDPAKMKELDESVRHNGVLVPVLLATCGNGKDGFYRLIAGERRLRAAKSAGLTTIPARVIEASPEKIEELQVLENLHRADLGPIEEARAFKRLLDSDSQSFEGLSERVDKSVKYVVRSVRLLELPETAIKGIETGVLSPEHGHQILRLSEDRREKIVEWALTPGWQGVTPTLHALKHEIGKRLERDLSRACFPKDREYAEAMACTSCPFNTGNQNMLFDGAEAGKCTNGACFTKKNNQFLREFQEKVAKRFKGLAFAGIGQESYTSQVKGAWVLKPEEAKNKKVQKLIEKSPEKFGFAVLKPSSWGSKTAPTAVIVCKDKDLMEAKIRKGASNGRTRSPEEQARERFLDAYEIRALYAEAAKKMTDVRKEHLINIVAALRVPDAAYEAMGMPLEENEENGVPMSIVHLTEKNLLRLAWLGSFDRYEIDDSLKSLDISAGKVRKEARAMGLTEWGELQAKAAQALKKEEAEKEAAASKSK